MPDNTDPADLGTAFDKHVEERVAPRGSDILSQERKHVDPATGEIHIERIGHPVCTCGVPYSVVEHVFRCAHCESTACAQCIIPLHQRHYCPTCIEQAYALDKRVFVTLLYIETDVAEPDDLTTVETVDDDTVEVTIDRAISTLVDHNYLDDTGDLTPDGREALALGQELYGDDPDVQSLQRTIRVREVANQGP